MAVSDINLVVISGRLTADPEARGSEGQVAAFSIASNRFFKKPGDDETTEEVVFIDVSAFKYEAKTALEKLRKASVVTVEGRLELNRWQNEAGENRQQIRLIANRITSPAYRNGNGTSAPAETVTEATEATTPVEAPTDDDIPF